jgi:hypothetical protein
MYMVAKQKKKKKGKGQKERKQWREYEIALRRHQWRSNQHFIAYKSCCRH